MELHVKVIQCKVHKQLPLLNSISRVFLTKIHNLTKFIFCKLKFPNDHHLWPQTLCNITFFECQIIILFFNIQFKNYFFCEVLALIFVGKNSNVDILCTHVCTISISWLHYLNLCSYFSVFKAYMHLLNFLFQIFCNVLFTQFVMRLKEVRIERCKG